MGFTSVGKENESTKTQIDLNHSIKVEKIISYDSESEFVYYYPRMVLGDHEIEYILELFGVTYELDLIIAALNHLIEVNCFTYDEFLVLLGDEEKRSEFYLLVSLRKLLFETFNEEYALYIRPLLSLSSSYIQVEAPFDKYYFMSKMSGYAYRIDPFSKLLPFRIINHDLTKISFLPENSMMKKRTISEDILTVLSTKVYSWFK